MGRDYASYAQVPWYGRSGIVSAMTVAGIFLMPTIGAGGPDG